MKNQILVLNQSMKSMGFSLLVGILITFACVSLSSAQDIVDSTVIELSETERIIDKYSDKIASSFNTVFDQLTPYAMQGFEMAVMSQIALGIACTIPIIIFLISLSIAYDIDYEEGPQTMGQLIGLVVCAVSAILSAITITPAIEKLVSPEWQATKEILNLL